MQTHVQCFDSHAQTRSVRLCYGQTDGNPGPQWTDLKNSLQSCESKLRCPGCHMGAASTWHENHVSDFSRREEHLGSFSWPTGVPTSAALVAPTSCTSTLHRFRQFVHLSWTVWAQTGGCRIKGNQSWSMLKRCLLTSFWMSLPLMRSDGGDLQTRAGCSRRKG